MKIMKIEEKLFSFIKNLYYGLLKLWIINWIFILTLFGRTPPEFLQKHLEKMLQPPNLPEPYEF